jgi:hypothetical protein
MPIKFTCPSCKTVLTVKDHLAGKKGSCPRCKQIVTVPQASSAPAAPAAPAPTAPAAPPAAPSRSSNGDGKAARTVKAAPPAPATPRSSAARPPASASEPPPPAPPADIESEAAALLSDEPAQVEQEVKTIDFRCEYCDEELHLPLELAGKRSPCPECKRIIKVPEPVKPQKSDWRNLNQQGPSGARPQTEPAPEGTWDTRNLGRVGAEALQEAGVLKKKERPRTRWQKSRGWVLGGAALVVLIGGSWWGYSWWNLSREKQALQAALTYADSKPAREQIQPTGQAALHFGASAYYLRRQEPGCVLPAREQFGKALTLLVSAPADPERDVLLGEMAAFAVELGGTGEETQKDFRLPWDETQKLVRAALSAIGPGGSPAPESRPARLEALRAVVRQLVARGQVERVLPIVTQLYSAPDTERAEAMAAASFELLAADKKDAADRAADQALSVYAGQSPPPVGAGVVSLALMLEKPAPKAGKAVGEEQEHHIGETEGLARQGKWEQAREKARQDRYGEAVRVRALAGVAVAAVAARLPESGDIETAAHAAVARAAEADGQERLDLAWLMLRLTGLGQRGSLSEDRLTALASAVPDRSLRGRAQLVLFRDRLQPKEGVVEEAVLEHVDSRSPAHRLARSDLARHNTRLDPGWARVVQGWSEPLQAFGSLGVARGLEDREKGKGP